jgi:DNA (cytosine-5)-methyltransferase 1
MKRITSIDLFAGVGGMRISLNKALEKLGLKDECKLYSEINLYCQQTYDANFPNTALIKDIKSIKQKDIKEKIPDHDILLAGFPCQPFSKAGVSKRKSLKMKLGLEDKKQGDLFFNILKIINKKKPKAFILENVENLKTYSDGSVLEKILKGLRQYYYVPTPEIIDAQDFGLAQRRKRIFIAGFLDKNSDFKYPEPTYEKTKVAYFLDKYPKKKYIISDLLWKSHQKRKIRNKKAGKGFGYKLTYPKDKYTRTISSRYFKDGGECLIYRGENRNPRLLSPREVFRLQGFPENFKIPVSNTQAYKQAGNAVPVNVVEKICINIIKYLINKKSKLEKVA